MNTGSQLRITCTPYFHKGYLKAQLTANGKRFLFTTRIQLHGVPEGQNGQKLLPYLQPYEAKKYEELRYNIVQTCYSLIERGLPLTRENIDTYAREKAPMIIQELERFIRYKEKMVSPVTIRTSYRPLLQHMKIFNPVNYDSGTHDEFYLYLAHEVGLSDNTIGRYFKRLREFFKKYHPNKDFSFIKRIDIPKLVISLSREELRAFEWARQSKTRDLWLCMCYGGFRYSDSQLVREDMITGDLLPYIQKKTGSTAYAPVNEFMRRCFKFNDGTLPQLKAQPFNRQLKALGKRFELNRMVDVNEYAKGKTKTVKKPLWTQLTSQVARKTFLTLMIKEGVPVELAMKFSGHRKYDTVKKHYMGDMTDKLQDIASDIKTRVGRDRDVPLI